MSNLLKKEKGFTLIEIVLVLAIAGLLLVIVFLAVQGAQRSRRDTQRKNDAARMLASIESCAANNNGSYTNCQNTGQLVGVYFNPATVVGGGGNYTVGTATQTSFAVNITGTGTCPGNPATHPVTVQVGQEAGAAYCVGN